MGYLLAGEKPWERFEATVIAARTHADLADGEAVLVAECEQAGRSLEFIAASDAGCVRIYRLGEPR